MTRCPTDSRTNLLRPPRQPGLLPAAWIPDSLRPPARAFCLPRARRCGAHARAAVKPRPALPSLWSSTSPTGEGSTSPSTWMTSTRSTSPCAPPATSRSCHWRSAGTSAPPTPLACANSRCKTRTGTCYASLNTWGRALAGGRIFSDLASLASDPQRGVHRSSGIRAGDLGH
jgi:hypothetical protein